MRISRRLLLASLSCVLAFSVTASDARGEKADTIAFEQCTSGNPDTTFTNETFDVRVQAFSVSTNLDYDTNLLLNTYVSKVNVVDPSPTKLGTYRLVWEDG